jgi:two-component system, cell cycle sensor histidine kinase and response regulator CckA
MTKETILVVDDDPEVLSMIADLLTEAGYSIRSTVDPREGLQIAGTYAGAIHLLLTDVVMPAMGGGELAKEFHTLRPDARVLFMSAHDDVENLEQHRIRLAAGEP